MLPEPNAPRRPSRLRLYVPFALLAVLVLAWSAGWFVLRSRTVAGMDEWLASEAAAGREWSCPGRSVAGFPFRIEVTCPRLSFARSDLSASLGRVLAVAQVYQPGHVIVEAQGPLQVSGEAGEAGAEWRLLQASLVFASGKFQRLALVAEAPSVKGSAPGLGPLDARAQAFEVHARPDPADATIADIAFTSTGAVAPALDALVGGAEPADLNLVLRVSKAADLPARPVVRELERWRAAGGEVEVARLGMTKGDRRLEAEGRLGVDESHRLRGEVRARVAGIEGLLAPFVGDRSPLAGNLLGALFGQPPASVAQERGGDPKAPRLRAVPPLRLDGGRLFVGPLQVPGLRLPALY